MKGGEGACAKVAEGVGRWRGGEERQSFEEKSTGGTESYRDVGLMAAVVAAISDVSGS